MAQMHMIEAANSALEVCLEKDPDVCIFGEDVGYFGGVFRATDGLQEKFGPHRVFDTPLAEGGIIATAIGMGMNGLRPIAEIQFADYIYPAFDQITNELAKLRYRSGGEWFAPVTIRTPCGGGIRGGHYHSQSPEAYFTHTPGLIVVMPSNPYDLKGMIISAVESNDPVLVLEPKRIYRGPFHGDPNDVPTWGGHPLAEVPEEHYTVPIGIARTIRQGSDITVLAWGTMVHVAERAILNYGISGELIDLRSLVPLDMDAIIASVKRTGRCVIVHEAPLTSGYGGEIAALVQEKCFYHLEAPIARVTGWDTPFPHSLEWEYMPSVERIGDAMKQAMEA